MTSLVCKTENLAEKIQFQKQSVALLKKEIFGTDKKPRSKYIRDFMGEFTAFEEISSYAEVLPAARQARIVYVGDYHALDKCQEFQARLLEDLADRPVILGIEMLYGRNQRALDDWLARRIDDEQFRKRVRYEPDWGYPWESYRRILEIARDRKIPVFGIDCSPRNDLRYISKRDTSVAVKIADILERYPEHTLVVSFGESHLASNHLPLKVKRHFPEGEAPRQVTILQNIDEIYWKISCGGFEGEQVVRLSDSVYCVFNATPFEKYESYRRELEIWKAQDQEDQKDDLSSTIYNLINVITDFIKIDKYSYCLAREGVCLEFFIDAYPEVYGFEEFDTFESLLQSSDLSRSQIHEILNHTMRQGSCYVPRVNAIFIGKFNMVHGAEEAAHFVNFALKRQRFELHRPAPLDSAAEFYLSVLEETLGYFGSKLIDSSRNQFEESPILHWKKVPGAMKRLLGISTREARWMRRFILAHKDLEIHYKKKRTVPRIISKGVASRGRDFTILTHELGYLLGEQLYRSYLEGTFSRRDISRLYRERFEEEGNPATTYFTLAEQVRPCHILLSTPRLLHLP